VTSPLFSYTWADLYEMLLIITYVLITAVDFGAMGNKKMTCIVLWYLSFALFTQ